MTKFRNERFSGCQGTREKVWWDVGGCNSNRAIGGVLLVIELFNFLTTVVDT